MAQNINLYDPGLRERRDLLGFGPAVGAVAAALLVVGLGAGAARWSAARLEPLAAATASDLARQQATAQALAARAATAQPDTALQGAVAKAQRVLLQRRGALQALGAGGADRDDGFSGRLEALARQSLDGLWLTGMALRDDDVLLKGRALRPALVPAYVQRLEQEPSLQGRAFKALDVMRPIEGDVRAVATPASGAPAEAPKHAEFVEFTLVGANGTEPAPSDKDGRK